MSRNQWGDPGGGAVTHRAIGRQRRENFLEGRHRGQKRGREAHEPTRETELGYIYIINIINAKPPGRVALT